MAVNQFTDHVLDSFVSTMSRYYKQQIYSHPYYVPYTSSLFHIKMGRRTSYININLV
jgi:hypothetical protein